MPSTPHGLLPCTRVTPGCAAVPQERDAIFRGNACRLLGLPVSLAGRHRPAVRADAVNRG